MGLACMMEMLSWLTYFILTYTCRKQRVWKKENEKKKVAKVMFAPGWLTSHRQKETHASQQGILIMRCPDLFPKSFCSKPTYIDFPFPFPANIYFFFQLYILRLQSLPCRRVNFLSLMAGRLSKPDVLICMEVSLPADSVPKRQGFRPSLKGCNVLCA